MNLQEHIRRILREEVELNPLEYLGMPEISKIEIGTINNVVINGDLYQFKTQDGLISGVMISPTEFRIEGISANEVGKGQGSKMFESLISYLKSKGVTTLTTESAGEGAVKMHNKAVEKGLLIKVKEDGRFATFTINNTKIDPTTTTNTKESLLNPNERVYDYDPERNTVPERLPFDIDKLVDSGVVFVTPAINGNPKSKNYKKWMKTPHTHLISLYNVENSSEDGWIRKAITKRAPTKAYKGNFVDKIYDGKYNQILWGLEKLGINPMDMLIDMNLQEQIRKVLREETNIKPILNNILNMLFDGFDDIYYDWAQYNCGMGVCCDPYAVGFVLPKNDYDDYLFKLVDGNNYKTNSNYPKHLSDELPEVCYEMPDVKNPNFNFIIFYEEFAEEIEDYLGPKSNWKFELLDLINEKFGCEATNIMFL